MNRLSELRNRITTLCTACCVLALTACSDDTTGDDSRLPDGEYPMTFTAAVDGLTVTRAGTADGNWTTTDRIAVQVSNEIKIYAPSNNGNNVTLTSDDPFYWQSKDETKTIRAWYCGDSSTASGGINTRGVPTSWRVQSNQNEGESYQMSDFLYAAPKDISFSGTDKSLAFTHQTARVVINIKKAEAATGADVISSVVIGNENNFALLGNYTAPSQGSAATTGTWNTSGGTTGTITPKDITASGSSNVLKTYAALVIPQNMSGKKFIAVILKDGTAYYYTPQDTDANLESGKQYTYNITVKHGYLEVVTVKTDSEWGDGGTTDPVESKIPVKPFTADDLKIGDYYYSDGTTSDGGYRKYPDGSTAILNIKPVLTNPTRGTERTCIGIVYWVGNIKEDNYGLLDEKFPSCTQGLVVSLWDMPAPDNGNLEMGWTYGEYEYVNNWLSSQDGVKCTWSERPGDFSSIQETEKMQGYANTMALKEYNKYIENTDNNKRQTFLVKPVKGLATFETVHQAPPNSSGWYWPSIKELKYMCWGQDNVQGTAGRNMLNTQIGKIGGNGFIEDYYWSSTEINGVKQRAWAVYFYTGRLDNYRNKVNDAYRVRPLLAF